MCHSSHRGSVHRAVLVPSPHASGAGHQSVPPPGNATQQPPPWKRGMGCQRVEASVGNMDVARRVDEHNALQRGCDEVGGQTGFGFLALKGDAYHPWRVFAHPPHRPLTQPTWPVVEEHGCRHGTKVVRADWLLWLHDHNQIPPIIVRRRSGIRVPFGLVSVDHPTEFARPRIHLHLRGDHVATVRV